MKKSFFNGCLAVAAMLLAGCINPIGADRVSPRQAYEKLHENALNSSHASSSSLRVLNRYGLEQAFEKNPDATLKKLQAIACADDRRDLLYALSELNFLNADRQSRSVLPGVPSHARDSYFASAVYAYLYLIGEGRDAKPNPFDVRFRTAGDLYNRGLAQGLIIGTNAQVQLASGPRQTPSGLVEVQFTQPGFPWNLDLVKAF